MEKVQTLPKNKIENLPKTSGVYFFFARKSFREGGLQNPIYIGKAINIKSRVKNHFNQPSYRDNLFIDRVDRIGFINTNSEIEALILEANLIKKYQPKYNVIWKDDKNYFYVAVAENSQKIPYIYITHRHNDSAEYIGPFVEGQALKKTLRFLRRAFPYYTSARHPKTKCTYCHLDLCPGPNPDFKNYKKNIKKLILILQGKRTAVIKSLRKEMKLASKENKFEEAGIIRDRIFALQQIMAHTHVISAEIISAEIISAEIIPSPAGRGISAGKMLAKIIGADKPVSKIECYDVSNIQGKLATGSMVVFINGKPDKSQYKKFKIRMKNEPNDIAMLKEILQRRFAHSEWPYPDAILIDGGKGQLNAALEIVKLNNSLKIGNWKLKILAIAKGRQELFIEGRENPIPLKQLPQEIYNLVKQLDDEAHRFAITYHKKLRKKNLFQ
jgi:excinuclease ABC subunit C